MGIGAQTASDFNCARCPLRVLVLMSHIRKVGELCRALVVSLLRRALKATGGGNGSALRDEKTAAQSTPEFAPSRSRYPAIILQSAEVGIAKNDSKSAAYENRTKSAQSGGLETNGPRERISGLTGSTQCGGFRAKARGYWRFQRDKSRRRKLVSEGLAEQEELAANPLRICSNILAWRDAPKHNHHIDN